VSAVAAEAPPGLSAARRFGAANAIDALGSGLFIPVSLLYFIATTPLSTVRIGLALTVASLLSIPFGPPVGVLVDRFGATPVLQAANLLQAAGFAGYVLADTFPGVLLCAWSVALGRAAFLGSYGVTIAALSTADGRELAFGRQNAIRNLGYAGGGLLSGLAISIGTDAVYAGIVAANAASYLVAFALMSTVPNTRRASTGRSERAWRTALSDRPYRVVIAVQFCLTASAFALYFVFPVYVSRQLGLPGWIAGGVFTFNALLVGFGQGSAVRAVTGRVRAHVLAAGHLAFGIGYVLMLAALHRSAAVAGVIVIAGTIVYTAGELLAAPITATLAAAAAPDHLRGRYLSLNQLAVSLATALSPAAFAALLARGPSATWLTLAMLALAGVTLSVVAGRMVPEARNRIGRMPEEG
jgi:MFS family permease